MPDTEQARNGSHEQIAEAVRARLEAIRESISRELCAIPPPVPGCDVNFNRLLEDRSKVVDELQRLAKLRAGEGQAVDLFELCRQSDWLDAELKARIERAIDGTAANFEPGC